MRRLSVVGFVFGLALLTSLVLWQGLGVLAGLFAAAGWQISIVPAYYSVPLACAALSWHDLFAPGTAPSWRLTLFATWVGLAVNWLLPVAQIGGELARARLLSARNVPSECALASVVGDKTLQVFSQALYTSSGLLLLVATRSEVAFGFGACLGVLLMGALAFLFYRAQRAGIFGRASKLSKRFFQADARLSFTERAAAIDAAIRATYDRRRQLVRAIAWRGAFRLTLVGESWLALQVLGHPVTLADAFILESLGQGVRSAAFAIPGGLGAQEGGFVAIGSALGLPTEVALALSLCKRFRELAIGGPALLAWQVSAGLRAFGATPND